MCEVCKKPKLTLWQVVYGDLFDTVVLEWCKLFGSDEENLHWKNFVSDVEEFRKRLLDHVNINVAAWDLYWCEMKTYRIGMFLL